MLKLNKRFMNKNKIIINQLIHKLCNQLSNHLNHIQLDEIYSHFLSFKNNMITFNYFKKLLFNQESKNNYLLNR